MDTKIVIALIGAAAGFVAFFGPRLAHRKRAAPEVEQAWERGADAGGTAAAWAIAVGIVAFLIYFWD